MIVPIIVFVGRARHRPRRRTGCSSCGPKAGNSGALRKRLKRAPASCASARSASLKEVERLSAVRRVRGRCLRRAQGTHAPLQRSIEQSGFACRSATFSLGMLRAPALCCCRHRRRSPARRSPGSSRARCVALLPAAAGSSARARSGCGKFEEQFPEAIDLIARALRAGHAFPTGSGDGGRRAAGARSAPSSSCCTTGRTSGCRCRRR